MSFYIFAYTYYINIIKKFSKLHKMPNSFYFINLLKFKIYKHIMTYFNFRLIFNKKPKCNYNK